MKVILDLTALVNQTKITQGEFDRYKQFSINGAESFLSNILVGVGFIALCRDILFFFLDWHKVAFGLFSLLLGIGIIRSTQQWFLFGTICILMGILMIGFPMSSHFIWPSLLP